MGNFAQNFSKIEERVSQLVYSPFKIVGSAGMDAEGSGKMLTVGFTAQQFEIQNLYTGEKRWLGFIGVGAGVSVGVPKGGSYSKANYPSTGNRIVMGMRQWTTNFDWADLEGNTFIYAASAGAVGGVSLSLLMFNYAVSEYYSYGIGVLQGLSFTTPGAGVMNFTGITKYL